MKAFQLQFSLIIVLEHGENANTQNLELQGQAYSSLGVRDNLFQSDIGCDGLREKGTSKKDDGHITFRTDILNLG